MNSTDPITVDQMKEISTALIRAIPNGMSQSAVLRWANSNNLLIKLVGGILLDDGTRDIATVLEEWKVLYKKFFNLDKDFSKMTLPQMQPGFNRLLVIASGVLPDQTLRVCSDYFPTNYQVLSEFGDYLDKVTRNDREPLKDYAIWVRDVAESEVEPPATSIKHRPAHPPEPEMTLLERLLFEIKYFSETGEHLDTEKATCCFGSSHLENGERPVVCFRDNHLQILWKGDHYTDVMMLCSPYWSRAIFV